MTAELSRPGTADAMEIDTAKAPQEEDRFLANVNFPDTAVTAHVAAGHDVVWVRNAAPGMSKSKPDGWRTVPNRDRRRSWSGRVPKEFPAAREHSDRERQRYSSK
jgi:hypothetical protein